MNIIQYGDHLKVMQRIRRIVKSVLFSLSRILIRIRWALVSNEKKARGKINLGCGEVAFDGYINIDIVPSKATDFVADISELFFLATNHYQEVRMDAVFEHLWRFQQEEFLGNCLRILKPGGKLIINWLPDFDMIVRAYQNKSKGLVGETFNLYEVYRFTHGDPQPTNAHQQIHKEIFTRESITNLLFRAGFHTIEIENVCYRDEQIPVNMTVTACK